MNKIITVCTISTLSLLIGCASPPLQYYTLSGGNITQTSLNTPNSTNNMPVIYISRLTVPDYLNTADITTRRETFLNHSINGRMSSILSVGATEFITNFLTDKNPNLWITSEAPVTPPTYQLMVNIGRFDLQEEPNKIGNLALEATWSIIPNNTKAPIQKQKNSFVIQGPIKTDSDIVQLEQKALMQLANNINHSLHQLH